MTTELAEKIISYGVSLRIYKEYSGRGMYGKTTTGVVGTHANFRLACEGLLLSHTTEHTGADPDGFVDEFRSDSLGMDIIWY